LTELYRKNIHIEPFFATFMAYISC